MKVIYSFRLLWLIILYFGFLLPEYFISAQYWTHEYDNLVNLFAIVWLKWKVVERCPLNLLFETFVEKKSWSMIQAISCRDVVKYL